MVHTDDLKEDELKVIVAGSRGYSNYDFVKAHLKLLLDTRGKFTVVSGLEKSGPDMLGVRFAEENNLKWEGHAPKWDDLEAPGAVIKTNKYDKQYNAKAGMDRNLAMAQTASILVAFWDAKSPGTRNMIMEARRLKLEVIVFIVNVEKQSGDEEP